MSNIDSKPPSGPQEYFVHYLSKETGELQSESLGDQKHYWMASMIAVLWSIKPGNVNKEVLGVVGAWMMEEQGS